MTFLTVPRINRERKQRLIDLMRHRTMLKDGLTSTQVFNEVYSDIVEEYHDKKYDTGQLMLEDFYYDHKGRIKRLVKALSRSNEDFRGLSYVLFKDEKTGKIKEYRYVNLKGSNPEIFRLREELLEREQKRRENRIKNAKIREENFNRPWKERVRLKDAELFRRRLRKLKAELRKQSKKITRDDIDYLIKEMEKEDKDREKRYEALKEYLGNRAQVQYL